MSRLFCDKNNALMGAMTQVHTLRTLLHAQGCSIRRSLCSSGIMHSSGRMGVRIRAAYPVRILYVYALPVRIELQDQLFQVEKGPLVSSMLPDL